MGFKPLARHLSVHLGFYGFVTSSALSRQRGSAAASIEWSDGTRRLKLTWNKGAHRLLLQHTASVEDAAWRELVSIPLEQSRFAGITFDRWSQVDFKLLPGLNLFIQSLGLQRPLFPLTIRWDNGEEETVDSTFIACCNLEWFNSEDASEPVSVTDRLGRPVRLVIEKLEVRRCELK